MSFWNIPSFEEMFIALWDGFIAGMFIIALMILSKSLLTPLPLTEEGLKNYNIKILQLDVKADWEDIKDTVNKNSKQAARSDLDGANIPNLSMQFKHQQSNWPGLDSIDQG